MPKIRSLSFTIRGEFKVFELHYNAKKKFHLREFPPDVQNITDVQIEGYSTEDGIIKALKEALKQYHDQISSVEKVIMIEINCSASSIMNETTYGYSGNKPGIPKWFDSLSHSGGGKGFVITWERLIKITANGEEYYGANDDWETLSRRYISTSKCDHIILGWTLEREEFLKAVDQQIDQMIMKIAKFFSDEKKLLTYMDSGQKLLG